MISKTQHIFKKLEFIAKSNTYSCVFIFLFLLFQPQYLIAQNETPASSGIITLSGGSNIISADESFNSQIVRGKINLKNSIVTRKSFSGQKISVIIGKSLSARQNSDFASQIKVGKGKEATDISKKVITQIVSHRANKNKSPKDFIKNYPSSDSFSKTKIISKHIANERAQHQDQNEADEKKRPSEILALALLHSQKYFTVNSKFFDFCYLKAFSARPPPSFV